MKNLIMFDLTRAEWPKSAVGIGEIEASLSSLSALVSRMSSAECFAVIRPSQLGDMERWERDNSSDQRPIHVSIFEVPSNDRHVAVREGLERGMQWIIDMTSGRKDVLVWVLSHNNRFLDRIRDFSFDQTWQEARGNYHVRFIAKEFELRVVNLEKLFRATENKFGLRELLSEESPNIPAARERHSSSLTRRVERELLDSLELDLAPKAREAVFYHFRSWTQHDNLRPGKTLFQHVSTAIQFSRVKLSSKLGIHPEKYHAFEASRAIVGQLLVSGVVLDRSGLPIVDMDHAMRESAVTLVDDWENRTLDELARCIFRTTEVCAYGLTEAELSGLLFHSRGNPEVREVTRSILRRLRNELTSLESSHSEKRFVLAVASNDLESEPSSFYEGAAPQAYAEG